MNLGSLKNKHKGADIWVIASGASMDYISPKFFHGKITIGVNRVNRKYDCTYIVGKDCVGFEELREFQKSSEIITAETRRSLRTNGGAHTSSPTTETSSMKSQI